MSGEHRTDTRTTVIGAHRFGGVHNAQVQVPPPSTVYGPQLLSITQTNDTSVPDNSEASTINSSIITETRIKNGESTSNAMRHSDHSNTNSLSDRVQLSVSECTKTIAPIYHEPMNEQQLQQVNSLTFEVLTMQMSECELFFNKTNDPRPYITVTANRNDKDGLVDTGAMISVIGYTCQAEIDEWQTTVLPIKMTVTGFDRSEQSASGKMNIVFTFDGETNTVPMILVRTPKKQLILGMNFCKAFNIKLCRDKEPTTATRCEIGPLIELTEPIEEEFYDCFEDVSQLLQKNIMDERATPIDDQTPFLLPKQVIQCTETKDNRTYDDSDSAITTEVIGKPTIKESTVITELNSEYHEPEAEAPVYCISSNETTEKPANWGLPEIYTLEVLSEEQATEAELMCAGPMAMLLELCSLEAEQRTEPATVRTAEGHRDTIDDIIPEKHQCVTRPHPLTPEQERVLKQVTELFPYTPETGELNCTTLYEQSIDTGDAKPVIQRQYPMSPQVLKEAIETVKELIVRGIVEIISWSNWRWPILFVRKPAGGGRICLDARGLNKLVELDGYPSLNVDCILRNLPTARFITSLDMTQAFHQIAIRKEDRSKTAFAIGGQLYCFKRAVMGFKNSPADLTKLLDRIFHDMPNVYRYVDDFIIITDTFGEHIQVLKEVANRLAQAQLSVSQKKSQFCCQQLTFLGYLLSEKGLQPNPERIQPIMRYKQPETVKDIRRLVGLVNWYRRFIPNAATLLTPFTELIKEYGPESQRKIQWTAESQEVLEQIKKALTEAPILVAADYSKPFKIYSDASLVAGSSVLTQEIDGTERAIYYHSVKFSTTQQNYSATERELLSVIAGLEKFRPWIDGTRITVVTDHQSIKWLHNLKEPAGKLARWAVRLQAFDVEFIHRPGKLMDLPDALSRAVDLIELDPEYPTTDTWYNQMKTRAATTKMEHYKVENGLLYHRNRINARTTEHDWVLCVPTEKVAEALTETHNGTLHPGVWKTTQYAKRYYYWPKMYQQIYDYVTKCDTCRVIKPTNEPTRTPVGEYRDPGTVGRMISIDLIGPLPASKIRAHQYAVVAIDCFSKYVFTKSMKTATATNVVEFLEKEVFFKFGVPEVLICDNGVQFASKVFDALLNRFKVRKLATPLYFAQANPVEATNKTVKTALRAKILDLEAEQTDWEYFLPEVTMRINTLPHTSTGMSAHYIVFGRNKTQSGDEYRALIGINPSEPNPQEKREVIFDEAAEQQRAIFETNKARYNLRAVVRQFKIGDEAFINNTKLSSAGEKYTQKLGPKRLKIRIKEKLGSDTYLVTNAQGRDIGKYHASMIMIR